MPYFKYWGKASNDHDELLTFHLLPHHCLDVAASGKVYLEYHPELTNTLATHLNLPKSVFISWFLFFLALHDLGKFSETFQNLQSEISENLRGSPTTSGYKNYNFRHDSLGFLYFCKNGYRQISEANWFGFSETEDWNWEDGVLVWMAAVTGHHGRPPEKRRVPLNDYFTLQDQEAIQCWIEALKDLFLSDFPSGYFIDAERFKEQSEILSWWAAGVTVIADWVGSNRIYFPYQKSAKPLPEYWNGALQNAEKAIRELGLHQSQPAPLKTFQSIFPSFQPSPLQQKTVDISLEESPQLFILEDVTGSGKTEAAVMLAHRMLANKIAGGIYFGLPTMATADAMYRRLQESYRKLFDLNSLPSLVLAHGSRDLSEDFEKSILPSPHPQDQNYQQDIKNQEETATAICNEWIADNKKKALLAEVGIGTLDQALLSILPIKYQSLRLIGLYRKILIVDEVHAYDPYMHRLLQTLLRFHSKIGSSVILLSATLPSKMKQELVKAFAEGAGINTPQLQEKNYPLLTHIGENSVDKIEIPIPARTLCQRDVKLDFFRTDEDVQRKIRDTVQTGQCICWIRNSVDDAQRSFLDIKETLLQINFPPEKLTLFHARFPMGRRLEIENKVLKIFGKESTKENREQQILIASPVVEQSLDLDFDVLISDLAPIDLLIQRAGREHRHLRNAEGDRLPDDEFSQDGRSSPIFCIFAPEAVPNPSSNWFSSFLPKSSQIYPDHGVLWLTARILEEKECWTMPDDARKMIEDVYQADLDQIPSSLKFNVNKAIAKQLGEWAIADQCSLNLENGYGDGWPTFLDEVQVSTRLGEKTVTVCVLRWDGQSLTLWRSEHQKIEMSQMRVYAYFVEGLSIPQNEILLVQLKNFQSGLPRAGRGIILMPLAKGINDEWEVVGILTHPEEFRQDKREPYHLVYNDLLGLGKRNISHLNGN